MAWCDYCMCHTCINGDELLYRAKTDTGKYICEVCFDEAINSIARKENINIISKMGKYIFNLRITYSSPIGRGVCFNTEG